MIWDPASAEVQVVELRSLGGADLRGAHGEEFRAVLAQPKRLALLVFLAASTRRGPTGRDILFSLFWPDLDVDHARQALNQSLRFLRKALGAETILSCGDDMVALGPQSLHFDVAAFDEACHTGEYARAALLYRGDFLNGFFVSDASAELEEWIAGERARLRGAASRAMWALADSALAAGDADGASHWADNAVRLARDDERGLRRLLLLQERIGDRAGAMRAYDEFASRLQREFGVGPSAETQAVVKRIREDQRQQDSRRHQADALPPPTLGASPDVTALAALGDVPAPGNQESPHHAVTALPARATSPAASFARVPWRRRATSFGTTIVTAACAVAAIAFTLSRSRRPETVRIAVTEFDNGTGDATLDGLGGMAAAWVTQGLQRAGLASVLPTVSARVAGPRNASDPADAGSTARAARRATGADLVVVGTYYASHDSVRYQVGIIDPRGTLRGAPVSVAAPRLDPMAGIRLVGERVTGNLATVLDSRFGPDAAAAGDPPTFRAYEEYVAGLDDLSRTKDRRNAIAHLERAADADSSYVHPLIALIEAYLSLGRAAEADSVARIVDRSRNRLAPFERFQLDRWQAVLRNDREAAYRASERLVALAPRSQVVLLLADDASATWRLREAVDVMSQLDPEWSWVRDWQEYWTTLAYDYHSLGEYRRELDIAQRARKVRPELLRFAWLEVQALIGLGRLDEVRDRLHESVTLPFQVADSLGNGWTPGDLLRNASLELRGHGHSAMAREVLEQAHRWFGSRPREEQFGPSRLYNRMQRLEELGRWREAAAVADSLLASGTQVVLAHALLGRAAVVRHDSLVLREQIAALSEPGTPRVVSERLYARAEIAAMLGDRDSAVTFLRHAFANGRLHTFWDHITPAFETLRDDARYVAIMKPRK